MCNLLCEGQRSETRMDEINIGTRLGCMAQNMMVTCTVVGRSEWIRQMCSRKINRTW